MAKYIDIDKAQLEFYKAHEGDEFTPNIITLQTFLLYYPPADVRPVVTCLECFHRREADGWCAAIRQNIENLEYFCADGVRKNDVL